MSDSYRDTGEAKRQFLESGQRQREKMVRERQQRFEISYELAEHLLDLEVRIRSLELDAEEYR
jgi:hypothetical protein